MGHEAVIYGWIEGATWKTGERYRRLQSRNENVLSQLPEKDEWPWLVRGIFALPAPWPQGTYRCQAIHLALTLKDSPCENQWRDEWIGKFEDVLRRLYWFSATLHIIRELDPMQTYRWEATFESMSGLGSDPPEPTTKWTRTVATDGA